MTTAVRRLLLALCLLVPATVIALCVIRIGWPFELEWMEGASLLQMQRILQGQALYVPPSVDFTPLIYPPLYFDLAARLSTLTGGGFLPLRLLSLVSFLACLVLVFGLVFRHTKDRFWSLVSLALFSACFEIGGAWFDLARVDMLQLAFLLGAWWLLEAGNEESRGAWRFDLPAAFLLLAAFLAKQSSLLTVLALAAWVLAFRKGVFGRGLMPAIAMGGITVSSLALNLISKGWFSYYIFELPARHAVEWSMLTDFWRFDLLAPLPFVFCAWILGLLLGLRGRNRSRGLWLLCLSLALIAPSWSARLHSGGYNNVLLPAYAFLAVVFGRVLCDLLEPRAEDAGEAFRMLPGEEEDRLRHTALYGICLLQFVLLAFNPLDHLPSKEDRRAGEALLEELRAVDGDAWLPSHPWMAVEAGGPPMAHKMALLDVLRSGDTEQKRRLENEIRESLTNRRWELVITDRRWYPSELERHYSYDGPAFPDSSHFWPVTGMRTRPEFVYSRKPDK